MCFTSSFAGNKPTSDNSLTLSGNFLKSKNVSYSVCAVNEDMSCTEIISGKGLFMYKIDLEVGKEYVITFTKGDKVKNLYVTVTDAGWGEIDVDFSNPNSAQMTWDDKRQYYRVRILLEPKYELKGNQYIAYGE